MTNINLTLKKFADAIGLGRSPSLTSPVASLLYIKETSGTDIRMTQDIKLRFVRFNRFVGFNFGQI